METKIALDYVLVIFLLLSSITLTRERGMLEIERIPSHNQVQFLSPYCGLIELARLFFLSDRRSCHWAERTVRVVNSFRNKLTVLYIW